MAQQTQPQAPVLTDEGAQLHCLRIALAARDQHIGSLQIQLHELRKQHLELYNALPNFLNKLGGLVQQYTKVVVIDPLSTLEFSIYQAAQKFAPSSSLEGKKGHELIRLLSHHMCVHFCNVVSAVFRATWGSFSTDFLVSLAGNDETTPIPDCLLRMAIDVAFSVFGIVVTNVPEVLRKDHSLVLTTIQTFFRECIHIRSSRLSSHVIRLSDVTELIYRWNEWTVVMNSYPLPLDPTFHPYQANGSIISRNPHEPCHPFDMVFQVPFAYVRGKGGLTRVTRVDPERRGVPPSALSASQMQFPQVPVQMNVQHFAQPHQFQVPMMQPLQLDAPQAPANTPVMQPNIPCDEESSVTSSPSEQQ